MQTRHGLSRQQVRRALAAVVLGAGAAAAQVEVDAAAAGGVAAAVAWTYAPAGSSFDGLLVADGVVVALDRKGRAHGLDAASGAHLWTRDGLSLSFGFGLARSPRADFDAILVSSDTGITALDRRTGAQLWHTALALGAAGPACTKTAVIAASADGRVYACDLESGEIRWQHDYLTDAPADPPGFSGERARFTGRPARPRGAVTDGEMVVFSVFDQCRMLALRVTDGARLWDFRTEGWVYGAPGLGPRNVFLGSQDKHLYAVDKQMGKLAWDVETGARVEAAAAPTERFAYFGSCDGNLYAVDQVVGRVSWKLPIERDEAVGGPIYSCPIVRGDVVYLAGLRGKVYAVDRTSGELRWKLRPLEDSEINSDLACDGERLFLTTRRSRGDAGQSAVVAIDLP